MQNTVGKNNRMKRTYISAFALSVLALVYYSCQKDYNKPDDAVSGIFGTRTQVSISGITLDSFPQLDPSGLPWDTAVADSLSYADIYYHIFTDPDSTNTGYYMATHFDNITPDSLPLSYTLTDPHLVPGFGTVMTMQIFDFEIDSVANVDTMFMTSFTFSITPGDTLTNPDPYPKLISVGNSDYKVRLGLEWK